MNKRMYEERKGNISVFRGCSFNCSYCAFTDDLQRMKRKCQRCYDYTPHSHLEVLDPRPPQTKHGEFLSVGLTGEISFMDKKDFPKVLDYCKKWADRTFLIQSKNPAYFLDFEEMIPDNVLLGTTIETNRPVALSKAPAPELRMEAMAKLKCNKTVTIEPILDFDIDILESWISRINPLWVWVGYDSDGNHLPEPSQCDTNRLIERLEKITEVKLKLQRLAWWEDGA